VPVSTLTAKQQKGGGMRRFSRQSLVFCLAAALIVLPMASSYCVAAETAVVDEEEGASAGAMLVDVAAVRPLGIATTALGLVGYVITLPFSIPGGNADRAWDVCVVEPATYTFKRPLGEF
jgi:hypothetical protein